MTDLTIRVDDGDKQRAFLCLLANPAVTPWTDPDVYALVHRHVRVLAQWSKRLGYQLAHLDQCYRLRRTPIPGVAAVGQRPPPQRSELLLTLYAAACLDDHRDESITLQELSDLVRLSAAGRQGWLYDPDQSPHRKLFVAAVGNLARHGVLELRTEGLLRDSWEQTGEGIGAGYLVHREALVLLIDAGDVDLALNEQPDLTDHRGIALLRRLMETQAMYPEELDEEEHNYLSIGAQRVRLASLVEEMTGGSVELRADAIILSLPPDPALPSELIIDFPATSAQDWASLAMIDRISTETQGSYRRLPGEQVRALAVELHATSGKKLNKELSESPHALLTSVMNKLTDIGLLRINEQTDQWTLTPLAARYRQADLNASGRPAAPMPLDFDGDAQTTLEMQEDI